MHDGGGDAVDVLLLSRTELQHVEGSLRRRRHGVGSEELAAGAPGLGREELYLKLLVIAILQLVLTNRTLP